MTSRDDTPLADRPLAVTVSDRQELGRGFFRLEQYTVTIPREGEPPLVQRRDMVRAGKVVAVLPVDLDRGEVVLIRQFRLPAQFATGRGDMVEIVAGRHDESESAEACAMRECVEEIGVAPSKVARMFEMVPTAGITDEHAVLYVGAIDADKVAERGGLDEETEETRPFRMPIAAVVEAVMQGRIDGYIANAFTIAALQWLALHHTRLRAML